MREMEKQIGGIDSRATTCYYGSMELKPSTTTLLRPESVAEMCGVSKPLVYHWIKTHKIAPAFDAEGQDPLFTREQAQAIAAWRVERLAERATKDND